MMPEASELQLFRKWTRVKIERVDMVTLNRLLMDHYHRWETTMTRSLG